MNSDGITRVIRTALDILLLRHPQRTSFGVIIGLVVHTLFTQILKPTVVTWTAVDLVSLESGQCIVFGLLLTHLPLIGPIKRTHFFY